MLCRSPAPLQIPGPAPQAFSRGQPGPSAVRAIQPELTVLHPPPSAASNPCNQILLLLLFPDCKFLGGRGYGSCLELHLARVLVLSLSPLPSSFKLLISSLYCSLSFLLYLLSLSFLKNWLGGELVFPLLSSQKFRKERNSDSFPPCPTPGESAEQVKEP